MDLEEKNKIIQSIPQKGFLGHPKGLFTLFFHRILGEILPLWNESPFTLLYVLFDLKRWIRY